MGDREADSPENWSIPGGSLGGRGAGMRRAGSVAGTSVSWGLAGGAGRALCEAAVPPAPWGGTREDSQA